MKAKIECVAGNSKVNNLHITGRASPHYLGMNRIQNDIIYIYFDIPSGLSHQFDFLNLYLFYHIDCRF